MLTSVFFDAGNTLLFADTSKTLAALEAAGFHATRAQLHECEAYAKHALDAPQPGQSIDQNFWQMYYARLTELLGAPESLVASCVAATRCSANWNQVLPGTREVLLALRARGLRLGVISNSDGGIARSLAAASLADCFDSVTDSTVVKIEKPDPRIFQHAMSMLSATPEASVYIGDTYSVDSVGAERAGMRAILMDTANVYTNSGHARITSLSELLGML